MTRLILAAALLALPAAAQHSRLSPQDEKALHEYELTPGKVDNLMAAGEKIKAYAQAHPEVRNEEMMAGKTLDDNVKKIESRPELVSILKSAGVQPRDFVLGMMSMMTAGMWAAMSQQYPNAKMPVEVNPKNVKFLQDHPEVMQKWEQAWSDKGRGKHKARPDDDDKDEQ